MLRVGQARTSRSSASGRNGVSLAHQRSAIPAHMCSRPSRRRCGQSPARGCGYCGARPANEHGIHRTASKPPIRFPSTGSERGRCWACDVFGSATSYVASSPRACAWTQRIRPHALCASDGSADGRAAVLGSLLSTVTASPPCCTALPVPRPCLRAAVHRATDGASMERKNGRERLYAEDELRVPLAPLRVRMPHHARCIPAQLETHRRCRRLLVRGGACLRVCVNM